MMVFDPISLSQWSANRRSAASCPSRSISSAQPASSVFIVTSMSEKTSSFVRLSFPIASSGTGIRSCANSEIERPAAPVPMPTCFAAGPINLPTVCPIRLVDSGAGASPGSGWAVCGESSRYDGSYSLAGGRGFCRSIVLLRAYIGSFRYFSSWSLVESRSVPIVRGSGSCLRLYFSSSSKLRSSGVLGRVRAMTSTMPLT